MPRWIGALNVAQGLVFAGLALEGWRSWPPAGVLAAAVAALQVAGGAAWLGGRGPRVARWADVAALLAAAALLGLHLQAVLHVVRHFHPSGAATAWQAMGGALLALPWLVAFPAWQLFATRAGTDRAGPSAGGLVALLLVPPLVAVLPGQRAFAPVDGEAAATWAFGQVTGSGAGAPPDGPGPVRAVVTVVRSGRLGDGQVLAGETLAEALSTLALRARPSSNLGVVFEAAVAEGSLWRPWLAGSGALVRPAETGLASGEDYVGAVAAWREAGTRRRLTPTLKVPALDPAPVLPGAERWVRYEGWIADGEGATRLHRTWAGPPRLTADAVREAAVAGARMIARNQDPDGRYAYVVRGPTGSLGGGYNFPRHAGATWYLARVAARSGDPELEAAARRGMAFLEAHTLSEGGRAWVLDPDRADGRAWVGTTSLALLAALALDGPSEQAERYAAFVASSVDERGEVRGDFDLVTRAWPEQVAVTYAQGQALLALAAARRAGLADVDDALARAAAYVEGPYAPGPGSRFFHLDDHWMCLAVLVVKDATGKATGQRVCDAYLASKRHDVPVDGSTVPPAAGPAAALAEAWIARAELERRAGGDPRFREAALAYARVLLDQQYRTADAPFLGNPGRLLGGFRDSPWALDVRVDSVQHIGCALLGVEQLLAERTLSGAMP